MFTFISFLVLYLTENGDTNYLLFTYKLPTYEEGLKFGSIIVVSGIFNTPKILWRKCATPVNFYLLIIIKLNQEVSSNLLCC